MKMTIKEVLEEISIDDNSCSVESLQGEGKYFVSATADVWSDLEGTYYVLHKASGKIVSKIFVGDNSDKYKSVAIYLYELLHLSERYVVLTNFCEFSNLYEINKGMPELVKGATEYLDEDELEYYQKDGRKVEPLVDYPFDSESINSSKNIDLPSYLIKEKLGWRADEFFVFDIEQNSFVSHFREFDEYDDNCDRNLRCGSALHLSFDNRYEMFVPLWKYYSLWISEGKSVRMVQKAKLKI